MFKLTIVIPPASSALSSMLSALSSIDKNFHLGHNLTTVRDRTLIPYIGNFSRGFNFY